jgi:hypothetical protein
MAQEQIVANITGKVRKSVLNGREYLVAPMTLIVPGVLSGSQGPILYPAEELSKDPSVWNGMPIVVYHPVVNGQPVSARDPYILDKQGIGVILRTKFNEKLTCEGWFDYKSVAQVDNRVLEALESGTPMELSTGLALDGQPAPDGAVFNGKPYTYIGKNYRPDHVAILPDQIGACSLNDGCGIHNVAALGHSQLRRLLADAIEKRFGNGMGMSGITEYYPTTYIAEVFDKYVVYEVHGKTWKIPYKTDLRKSTVELANEAPVEVSREVSYKPLNEAVVPPVNNESEEDMQKKELVSWLISNCECWQEEDRSSLEAMNEKKLQTLKDNADRAKKVLADSEAAKKALDDSRKEFEVEGQTVTFNTTTNKWEKKAKPAPAPTPTIAPVESRLTPEEQEDLAFARSERNRQKETIVNRMTANLADPSKTQMHQYLMGKPLAELQALSALVPQNANQPPQFPDIRGAAGGYPTVNKDDLADELLPLHQ